MAYTSTVGQVIYLIPFLSIKFLFELWHFYLDVIICQTLTPSSSYCVTSGRISTSLFFYIIKVLLPFLGRSHFQVLEPQVILDLCYSNVHIIFPVK